MSMRSGLRAGRVVTATSATACAPRSTAVRPEGETSVPGVGGRPPCATRARRQQRDRQPLDRAQPPTEGPSREQAPQPSVLRTTPVGQGATDLQARLATLRVIASASALV